MSLYGALYTGVTGLNSQSSAIAIISDNIANINTIGYKQGSATFETLVTNTSSVVRYSPGGVLSGNRQLIDQQGLLQATNSPTDIAISGAGFFVVSDQSDGSGRILFTRAGSFRPDNIGNFVNAAGYYLQGWPLDRNGNLPGAPGNLNTTSSANTDSLETVNVESTTGVAAATTKVEVGANLDAREPIYEGAGITINMFSGAGALNNNIAATDIIAHDAGAMASGIDIGDQIFIETSEGLDYTFRYGGFGFSDDITATGAGSILGATTVNEIFTTPNNGDQITINTATSGTVTFTFKQSSPNVFNQEFNNLKTLATAINEVTGLSARIVNNRLYLAAENPAEAVTLNGDPNGTNAVDLFDQGGGGDGIFETGFGDVSEFAQPSAVLSVTFNSLQSLADLVNASSGLDAVIESPLDDATLIIRTENPLGTVSFFDGDDNDLTVVTNTGSLLNEFGMATDADYVTYGGPENAVAGTDASGVGTGTWGGLGPNYDATDSTVNMASGAVTADFSRNVRIFDALGQGHDLRMSFLKIATNTWAVEVHAIPEDDINSALVDGQISYGTITFNGDGSLRNISSNLRQPIDISWTNGAIASAVTFDWGTAGQPFGTAGATAIGLTDGLSQFAADYNVAFVNQNGAEVGELIGVAIDKEGYVIASYSNGESQRLFKIPIADFAAPNLLNSLSGNVYSQTDASGELNLREAGTNGTGTVVAAALEQSNVELAEELTDMIIAQRAYQANTKVISTSDELLDELTRL